MDKSAIIERTIVNIRKLTVKKLEEVNEYVEFILSRLDEQIITQGIQEMASESKSFAFLEDELDLYSANQYITDQTGRKISVILPIETYKSLMEELNDIKLYDEAKKSKEGFIPIEEAYNIVEMERSM